MRKFAIHVVLPVALAVVPLARAQVLAAGAAGAVAVAPHLAAAVPAVLTGAVSAGSAHVGQAVLARLATASLLSDGTKLPAGTQLLGKVTQAVPLSKGSGQSSLGMAFDRFKLPGGQERSLGTSILRSIQSRGNTDRSDDDTQAGADAGVQTGTANARARANANANSNGGLLGGVVNGVGNTVGGVVNGVGNTVGDVAGGVTQTVGGLANVVLNSTGTLTSQRNNVSVPAGTRVTIAASAEASGS